MSLRPVEIQLSKYRLSLMLAGSLIFIFGGGWLIWYDIVTPYSHNRRAVFCSIIGIAAILFFGMVAVLLFKKMFDEKPGLIINEDGIFDNSGGLSIGFIPWTDIVEIHEVSPVRGQTFINVIVKNPSVYIMRQKTGLKRLMMKINYKYSGSVVGITANGLDCSRQELVNLLKSRFYKSKHS